MAWLMYICGPVLILLISFVLPVGRDDYGEIQKAYASCFVFFGNSIISYFLFENLEKICQILRQVPEFSSQH